jgi:hypothetical protein
MIFQMSDQGGNASALKIHVLVQDGERPVAINIKLSGDDGSGDKRLAGVVVRPVAVRARLQPYSQTRTALGVAE